MRTLAIIAFSIINLFELSSPNPAVSLSQPHQEVEPQPAKAGSSRQEFTQLYNGKDLNGWTTKGNWLPQKDGSLLISPRAGERGWDRFGCYLWSEEQYENFELHLECRYPKGGNSGVYFRVGKRDNPVETGIETQVFDSSSHVGPLNDHVLGGIIPGGIAPTKNKAKPPGEWNHLVIRCVGSQLQVRVNGEQVIDIDLQKSKLKDRPGKGYIGLQDHGVPHSIRFRNIRIKNFKSTDADGRKR